MLYNSVTSYRPSQLHFHATGDSYPANELTCHHSNERMSEKVLFVAQTHHKICLQLYDIQSGFTDEHAKQVRHY